MKIFISWSGKRSKAVGELLDEWLQCVIQAVEPWMSSKDIDRGSIWFSQINDQLKDTGIGIVCITSSNLNKPWILFEAGALAKGLSSNRVCTFLIDLSPSDIGDPLSQFNHTLPNKDGVWSLVRTLNSALDDNMLTEKILENVFETYWPQFEKRFSQIIEETKDDAVEIKRDESDILGELLAVTRTLNRRMRSIENSVELSNTPIIRNIREHDILQHINDNDISLTYVEGMTGEKYFVRDENSIVDRKTRKRLDREDVLENKIIKR